jgi:hypothetical protein
MRVRCTRDNAVFEAKPYEYHMPADSRYVAEGPQMAIDCPRCGRRYMYCDGTGPGHQQDGLCMLHEGWPGWEHPGWFSDRPLEILEA